MAPIWGCEVAQQLAPEQGAAQQELSQARGAESRAARARRVDSIHLEDVEMTIVQRPPGSGYFNDLAEALQLLEDPGTAAEKHVRYSGPASFSDLEGACCVLYPEYSRWEDLVPFPGSGQPAPEAFVVRLRAWLVVPPASIEDDDSKGHRDHPRGTRLLTLAVGSDDGFRLTVQGKGKAMWTAEYPYPRSIWVGPLMQLRTSTKGERYRIELVYFESGGGAILHMAAAEGAHEEFSPDVFRLLDCRARRNGNDPLADDGDQRGPDSETRGR
jgi:hypothetical protein